VRYPCEVGRQVYLEGLKGDEVMVEVLVITLLCTRTFKAKERQQSEGMELQSVGYAKYT